MILSRNERIKLYDELTRMSARKSDIDKAIEVWARFCDVKPGFLMTYGEYLFYCRKLCIYYWIQNGKLGEVVEDSLDTSKTFLVLLEKDCEFKICVVIPKM